MPRKCRKDEDEFVQIMWLIKGMVYADLRIIMQNKLKFSKQCSKIVEACFTRLLQKNQGLYATLV